MTSLAKKSSRWTPIGVAAVVLGFVVWWPLGLATLAYIIWGGSVDDLISDCVGSIRQATTPRHTSGNAAFDAYKAETLKRLEEEQKEFSVYLDKLRQARDSEEFDRFMSERNTPEQTK